MNFQQKSTEFKDAQAISLEFIRGHFAYDPLTGKLTRTKTYAPGQFVGQELGGLTSLGYVKATVCGAQCQMHRLIRFYVLGEWPSGEVDHVNRDRADNRWSNLRDSTRVSNGINRPLHASNKSGYTGVTFDKGTNKWRATGRVNGKNVYLGLYLTPEEAAKVAAHSRKQEYGSFVPDHVGSLA